MKFTGEMYRVVGDAAKQLADEFIARKGGVTIPFQGTAAGVRGAGYLVVKSSVVAQARREVADAS